MKKKITSLLSGGKQNAVGGEGPGAAKMVCGDTKGTFADNQHTTQKGQDGGNGIDGVACGSIEHGQAGKTGQSNDSDKKEAGGDAKLLCEGKFWAGFFRKRDRSTCCGIAGIRMMRMDVSRTDAV